MNKRPLILDLDFTLLHLESQFGVIEVPGRTRSAYLSLNVVRQLHDLQNRFDLVLATARSWDGALWVVEGLEANGVAISGLVLEDGALWGTPDDLHAWDARRDWDHLRASLESRRGCPAFEWQHDFQACLVARCADRENAAHLMESWAKEIEPRDQLRLFRDGRKVYALPQAADKWSALQRLLGESARRAAGAGDGKNDLCWLKEITTPATFSGGDAALVACVQKRGGYVTSQSGHEGIEEILQFLGA